MCDGGGGFLKDIGNAIAAPVEGLISGDPLKTAQALFAPSTLVSEQPGIIGNISQAADTAVAGAFGGPFAPLTAGAASAIDTGLKGGNLGQSLESGGIAGVSEGIGNFATGTGPFASGGAGTAGATAPLASAGGGVFTPDAATISGDATGLADTGATSPGITALSGAPGAGAGITATGGGSPVASSPGVLQTIGNDINTAGTNVGNFLSNNLPSWLGGTPTAGSTFGTVGEAAPGAGTVGALASPDNFGVINNVTGTVAGAGAPALSAGGGGGGSSAGLFGDIGSFGNKLTQPGALLGIAGLGYEALKGTPTVPNLNNLTTEAASAFNTEQQLISPELTGQLPPGAAAGVAQGLESAKAQIRAQFANDGLTGSSAEADALASADQAAASQSFQIAASMANQGLNLAGLSSQIYEQIIQQTLGSDTAFNQALVNFGTAAAGGGARIQIGGTNG